MTNRKQQKVGLTAVTVMVLLSWPTPGRAQAPAPTPAPAAPAEDLAKKLANPISDLVSVPFQFNWEQNVGPSEPTRFILNVQPVMPFSLNKDWNLITRVIVPLVSQPPLVEGGEPAFGVGDITDVVLHLSGARRVDLGSRTGHQSAVDHYPDARQREVERRSDSRRAEAVRPVDGRHAVEPGLVLLRQQRPLGRQPDVPAAVRRVSGVPHVDGHRAIRDDRELESRRRQVDDPDQCQFFETVVVRRVPGELSVWRRRVSGASGRGPVLEGPRGDCRADATATVRGTGQNRDWGSGIRDRCRA